MKHLHIVPAVFLGICALALPAVAAPASDGSDTTAAAIANELCSELDPGNVNSLVSSPVPLPTHGACITYMLDGGTLRVLLTISGTARAYITVGASGRVSELIVQNGIAEPPWLCQVQTEWLESPGGLRVEATAYPGQTVVMAVPDGFYLSLGAGKPYAQVGNSLQRNFNSGGGGTFVPC